MAGRIGGLMADLNYDKKAAVKALKAKRGQTTPRSLTGTARSYFDRFSPSELSRMTRGR
jgi:hypothetical protein